jgi:RND family efflux transporter MFP subunit
MTRIYTLLASVLLSNALIGCSEVEEESITIRPVRTIVVGSESLETRRAYNGKAQTDRVIDLGFRSTGIITRFDIKLGQQVEKGDLLAELDNVAARLAYEQAVSARNSAKSDMDTKESNLNRVRSLYEKGGLSLSDYESAKNLFRTAQGSYRSAQRSVEIQQEQIRYGRIFAPESGVIAVVNKEIDENVAAGETVAILNAGTEMEIQVGLPESVINQVVPENTVTITFAAIPSKIFAGEITEVSPAIERSTATYPVRVRVLGSTDQIKSGMAATVNFDFNGSSNSSAELLLPATAVGEDVNGRYVFTVDAQPGQVATVKKQMVTIGSLVRDSFEIRSGLKAGDIVITAGVHSVLDGQKVRVQ